jgi:hypothetical protein
MRVQDRPGRPSRTHFRPVLEGLEIRDLPSGLVSGSRSTTPSLARLEALIQARQNAVSAAANPGVSTKGQSASTPAWVNPSLLQGLATTLYQPITTTTPIRIGSQIFPPGAYSVPQPTPAEIQRETFWAEFSGTYYVGAPRFSNQSATIHIYSNGKSVASNQFSHGRGQLLLFPPADPTATPNTSDPLAGRVAGLLFLNAANVLQSGTLLFAEVTNLPGVASNDPTTLDHGLPSHLSFAIDPGGVTGGIYVVPAFTTTPATLTSATTGVPVALTGGSGGAVATNQGAGVVDITYVPDSHPRAGAVQSGKVLVRVQGLLNVTGAINPLLQAIN